MDGFYGEKNMQSKRNPQITWKTFFQEQGVHYLTNCYLDLQGLLCQVFLTIAGSTRSFVCRSGNWRDSRNSQRELDWQ